MATWDHRRTTSAVQWANTPPGGTIILQMGDVWNEQLAKAAIDMAKKLHYPESRVLLKAGSRDTVVKDDHTIRAIRKRVRL